ncbi:MAG: hypothetical protein HYU87_05970 [Chloroflexi bacterium]|nr:hypothetical protein [Chloroflexota bacterium]
MTLGPAAAAVRTGVAALAIAVALQLLLRIPLVATFRAALIALAAIEVLAFGQRALSMGVRPLGWIELAVKLAVLAVAYLALSG